MKKPVFYSIIFSLTLLVACVPARKLEELQVSYDDLKSQFDELTSLKEYCDTNYAREQRKFRMLLGEYETYKAEAEKQQEEFNKVKDSYELLNRNYKDLVASNELTKNDLRYELERLDKKLDQKERELFDKEASLLAKETETAKLKKELDALDASLKEREKRVNELESQLAARDAALTGLKDKLTNALIGYEGSGITVVQKDGKVYVSLDNSLLFKSGKTDIDWKGKEALLKVAESLKDLEDFDIMVEGHTDNVPMRSSTIKDNWDLSVLRATSVVRYMTTEGGMDPLKIIPSGRSKYVPIDPAKTSEARAKNRRIEIILTPKLDQLMEIIK
jgi:chemotaxis protein MotB